MACPVSAGPNTLSKTWLRSPSTRKSRKESKSSWVLNNDGRLCGDAVSIFLKVLEIVSILQDSLVKQEFWSVAFPQLTFRRIGKFEPTNRNLDS